MEFLHPTDFPLTVLTDASHGIVVGGVVDVVAVKIGFVLANVVVFNGSGAGNGVVVVEGEGGGGIIS